MIRNNLSPCSFRIPPPGSKQLVLTETLVNRNAMKQDIEVKELGCEARSIYRNALVIPWKTIKNLRKRGQKAREPKRQAEPAADNSPQDR